MADYREKDINIDYIKEQYETKSKSEWDELFEKEKKRMKELKDRGN